MTQSRLRLSMVTDAAQLENLRPAWNDLLERSAVNEPVLSPLWQFPWWQTYGAGTGRELQIGLFHDGERLVGLAPLQRRRFKHRPGIPFRRLEFLAADVDEHDGVASDYLNIIAARGQEERLAQSFVAAMAERAFGKWDEIVLAALDGGQPQTALLEAEFARAGFHPVRTITAACPFVSLPGSWEEYLQKLPGDKRGFVKKSLREFEAWAGTDWQIHEATAPRQLTEGKRILASLHSERWSADKQTGVFHSGRFARFHDAVMPALLAQNSLELIWLSVRGQPIAALYNFIWQGKVYYYQTGRSLDVPKEVRAGVVILIQAIRRAIAAGRHEFDFLAGAAQYKMKLSTATRPLVQIRVARRSFVEYGKNLADLAIVGARKFRHARQSFGTWWKKR